MATFSATENASRLAFSAESALQIDSTAYQQEQSKPSASDSRTTKVKTASAEQDKKNKNKQDRMHLHMSSHLVQSHRWGLSLLSQGLEIELLEAFVIPWAANKKSRTLSGPAFRRLFVGLEREANTATDVGNIAAATEVVTPVGKDTDIVRDAVFDAAAHVTETNGFPVPLEIRAATDHDIWGEVP